MLQPWNELQPRWWSKLHNLAKLRRRSGHWRFGMCGLCEHAGLLPLVRPSLLTQPTHQPWLLLWRSLGAQEQLSNEQERAEALSTQTWQHHNYSESLLAQLDGLKRKVASLEGAQEKAQAEAADCRAQSEEEQSKAQVRLLCLAWVRMQELVSYAALGKAQHAQLQADEAEQTNMALQERVETLRHQLAAAQADTEAYRSAAEEATNEQVCRVVGGHRSDVWFDEVLGHVVCRQHCKSHCRKP